MATRATDDDGKLLFGAEHDGSGKLLFGDAGGSLPPAPPATVSVDASLPGLGSLTLRVARQLELAADLPGLDGSVALVWDANVSRAMQQRVHAHWQDGAARHAAAASHWQDGPAQGHRAGSHWQDGSARASRAASHWQDNQPRRARAASHWQDAAPRSARTGAHWQAPRLLDVRVASHWQDGDRRQGATQVIWQEGLRLHSLVASHWQDGELRRLLLGHISAAGLPVWLAAASHWQDARRPSSGQSHVAPIQPRRPPCYDEATAGRLVFTDAWGAGSGTLGRLVFVCGRGGHDTPPAVIYISPANSYIVINHIEIHRAGSADLLPCESLGMTLERDSWTWSFTATFALGALDALMPGSDGAPVELRATINGQPFGLLAERISRSVRFPERLVKVTGRGLAAVLDAPYAPVQTFSATQPRTAHQLMLDVLTLNGVSMGWQVDWQLTDWHVPAGAFMHQGTWASALNHIAGAAGGYIQPHDTDARLHVLPAWPQPWWRWAGMPPDIELPRGVAEVEDTEWVQEPAYNRIFISGEAGGILGDYKRAGTAGEVLRPMVVHPLITDEAAARQRATAELAQSGRLIRQSLTLMVLPATGIIKPGRLLRYTDAQGTTRLGLVRATALQWAFPALTQTITLQSHA